MKMFCLLFLSLTILCAGSEYGVDTSFPIHHTSFKDKNSIHAQRYQRSMTGCYEKFSRGECDATERARIQMNLQQPALHHNYTEMGFKKTKVPAGIWSEIKAFWEENKSKKVLEEWNPGNTYVNNWESPSYMVSFENRALRGGIDLKQRIWDALRPIISEWVGGKELVETSLYGIRMYSPGSILAPHVDRLPLVSSAIIQVAQDVDEPWPAEIYSHDGKAYNVSMEPGDMCMYESHTTLHGRPFPLKGRYYANIFVHFKPVEYDEINEQEVHHRSRRNSPALSGHEHFNHDEEDIRKHKEEIESEMRMEEAAQAADGYNDIHLNAKDIKDGRTALHIAASRGDLRAVRRLLKVVVEGAASESDILHARDANNWQAVHEAARAGHLEVLEYLVERGADLSAQTRGGGSVLYWARRTLDFTHPVIKYLESVDAPETEEVTPPVQEDTGFLW